MSTAFHVKQIIPVSCPVSRETKKHPGAESRDVFKSKGSFLNGTEGSGIGRRGGLTFADAHGKAFRLIAGQLIGEELRRGGAELCKTGGGFFALFTPC